MRGLAVLALICAALTATVAADTKLRCYQCQLVTSECKVDDAEAVTCGSKDTARCSKQVKKGATEVEKAIRKCVVPDNNGQVRCQDGFDCHICDTELCNAGIVAKSAVFGTFASVIAALYI